MVGHRGLTKKVSAVRGSVVGQEGFSLQKGRQTGQSKFADFFAFVNILPKKCPKWKLWPILGGMIIQPGQHVWPLTGGVVRVVGHFWGGAPSFFP